MLLELNLRNFILIEDIRLSFHEGLNIVTGETGAGKSIILEGLRICLGNRTSKDYLRDQSQKATFEMIFSTPEDFFAITREIFPSGKAISRLNGDIVNVEQIQAAIGPYLDIYGQRDHFYLLDPSHQRDVIDAFDPEVIEPIKQLIEETVRGYQTADRRLKELEALAKSDVTRERQILGELKALALDLDRDSELEATFSRLNHLAEIVSGLTEASELFAERILSDLDRVRRNLEALNHLDPQFATLAERLESARLELDDLAQTIRQALSDQELDETELRLLNERIEALHSAKKLYQRDLAGLIEYQASLEIMIEEVESLVSVRQALHDEKAQYLSRYELHSKALAEERSRVFNRLKLELIHSLVRMELPDVSLDLEQIPLKGEPSLAGRYQAEILASMNQGKLRPMKDVLSGGEMSRFILALKQVFSRREKTLCMVFDEIDTGISGKTAFEVGRNIKQLAQAKQVIAITHLPQLAAFADTHYQITKEDATTTVGQLNESEHVARLAFMMSSSLSQEALASAKELIQRANQASQLL